MVFGNPELQAHGAGSSSFMRFSRRCRSGCYFCLSKAPVPDLLLYFAFSSRPDGRIPPCLGGTYKPDGTFHCEQANKLLLALRMEKCWGKYVCLGTSKSPFTDAAETCTWWWEFVHSMAYTLPQLSNLFWIIPGVIEIMHLPRQEQQKGLLYTAGT